MSCRADRGRGRYSDPGRPSRKPGVGLPTPATERRLLYRQLGSPMPSRRMCLWSTNDRRRNDANGSRLFHDCCRMRRAAREHGIGPALARGPHPTDGGTHGRHIGKPEIRISKSETTPKSATKAEIPVAHFFFELRYCFVFRNSIFGFAPFLCRLRWTRLAQPTQIGLDQAMWPLCCVTRT